MMKTKAQSNLVSAQNLISCKQYTDSVHCSYYAVFQYMKYMLAHTDRRPITLEDQNATEGDHRMKTFSSKLRNGCKLVIETSATLLKQYASSKENA